MRLDDTNPLFVKLKEDFLKGKYGPIPEEGKQYDMSKLNLDLLMKDAFSSGLAQQIQEEIDGENN